MKQCQMKQCTAHLSKNVAMSSKLIIVNFLASASYVTSLHQYTKSLPTSRTTATKYVFSDIANFSFDVNLTLQLRHNRLNCLRHRKY